MITLIHFIFRVDHIYDNETELHTKNIKTSSESSDYEIPPVSGSSEMLSTTGHKQDIKADTKAAGKPYL